MSVKITIAALIYEAKSDIEIDADNVSANCGGLLVSGPQSTVEVLQSLLDVYDIIVQETAGVIRFFHRGTNEQQITIDIDDLAAHEDEDDVERLWSITDPTGIDLPSEVNISYIDPGIAWQKGCQKDKRLNATAENVDSSDVPITMTGAEAKTRCRRKLWTAWLNRFSIKISLPPKYFILQENDLLILANGDEYFLMRIFKLDRGNNFLIQAEGIIERTIGVDFSASADDFGGGENPPVYSSAPIGLKIIDIAPLSDYQFNTVGYYYAVYMLNSIGNWRGAVLYEKNGEEYEQIATVINDITAGSVDGTLADGEVGYWDRKNTIDVLMDDGELESKTEAQCLSGANCAIVGDEIIIFQNAELIDTNKYRLTNLLRGLRNTEDKIATHQEGEPFVLLEAYAVNFKTMNLGEVGIGKTLKIVPSGLSILDIEDEIFTPQANILKPFSPCHIKGTRDGSNNLTITWLRRDRRIFRIFSGLPVPMSESFEKYEIDIMDGETILRTIAVSDVMTADYSAAQQMSDGLTPGNPVTVRIYQMSSVLGRGRVKEQTI